MNVDCRDNLYPMNDFYSVLVSEDELKDIINSISASINADYKGKKLLLCGVLKGAYIFMSDLSRRITLPHEITFIRVSSYGAGSLSGNFNIAEVDDLKKYTGYSLLIVDDIYDTGNTADYLLSYFKQLGFSDVNLCVLLEKPARNEKFIQVKYSGRKIDDEFVVGYGLDYSEKYRYLPFLAALKREVYDR